MMSILIEQLINITDAIFLGHVGEIELGASALAGIWYLAIYMLGFIPKQEKHSFKDCFSCRDLLSFYVCFPNCFLRLF